MAQRAAWRTRRQDPRTWLGWLAQDARGPVFWISRRLGAVLAMLAAAFLFSGKWFPALVCFSLVSVPEQVAFALCSMWGGRFLPGTNNFVPRPLPIDTLLTIPSPAPQFPCRIEVARSGTMLGWDVGIVTFVDGWLHYEGYRVSFAIRRCDATLRTADRLKLAAGETVTFEPQDCLLADELVELDLKNLFKSNLKSWMRSEVPVGEPVLPPATFHPNGAVRAWSNLATASVSCVLYYVFLITLNGSAWAALLFLPFLVGFLRSLVDLRRLRLSSRLAAPVPFPP